MMSNETTGISGVVPRWRVLVVDEDVRGLQQAQRLAGGERVHIIPALTPVDALQVARMCHLDAVVVREASSDAFGAAQLVRLLRRMPHGDRMPILSISPDPADGMGWPLTAADVCALRSVMAAAWGRATVLLLDDDFAFVRRVVPLLARAGLDPRIGDPRQVFRSIEAARPELLVLSPGGDGSHGMDVVRVIRSAARWRHLPILVIAGAEGVAAALRAGANGILERDGTDEETVTLLRQHIERSRVAAENVEHDPLTGMLRPRAFLNRLSGDAHGERRALGLASFRLEGQGDLLHERVLAQVASQLATRGEPEVLWCRWGARELAFGCAAELAGELAREVQRVATAVWEELGGGLTSWSRVDVRTAFATSPEDGTGVEGLLLTADRRLTLG